MFTGSLKSSSARGYDVVTSIEGSDIYNSKLLRIIGNYRSEDHIITKYEKRPDLIAFELYGDYRYYGLLMMVNKITVDEYLIGTTIQYFTEKTITELNGDVINDQTTRIFN